MKKNRIIYISLFIASLIYIYYYGGKIPYMFFSIIVILPVVSFIYTNLIYHRFKYTQEADKKFVMKGDKINFIFKMHNEDILLYPFIRVTFFGSNTIFARQFQSMNFSLLPRSRKEFFFELECKYRGNYEMGLQSVEIEDFLGIFKFSYKLQETKYITVYPRIVYLDNFLLNTNFLSESHAVLDNRYEDMTTISDIRKYAYGDGFRKIHWKLTAKSNELKVKNYQSTSATSAFLLLDLKKNKFDLEKNTIIEDKVIEALVAVLHYCLAKWIPIKLVYFNKELVYIDAKNTLDFDELYKLLSKIGFQENVGIKDVLNVFNDDNINLSNFVIFTSNLNYGLFDQICKTKLSGNDLSIVYVSSEELTGVKDTAAEEIINYLPEIGVKIYRINISDDIKSVLER